MTAAVRPRRAPRSREAARPVDVTANITYRLIALTGALGRSAARDIPGAVGVSVPEWRVLSVIGSQGPISLARLARVLGVDKGWISRTVAALERQKLVDRTPDPADDRMFELTLNARGQALHLRGSTVSMARQRRLEEALGDRAERDRFYAALARLQAVADAMDAATR